ncbi:MarR family winged helix-turn-helix transcriptional regulator [Actinophytocola sp.]|uniref:MarR family winged helix-turn-helix transcriptional regulator n=1 Tax=Actinophytocola sp. TaxID=1872138 RepID=UPI002ED1F0C5
MTDATEWLSDEEQQAWRGLIHMTAQLNARLNRELQEEHGISLADYAVLGRLSEAPDGGIRARDLESTLAWEQSRLSHHLARMQRRGLVERRDCPSDRRGATFTLTETGRNAIEKAAPGHVTAVRRLLFDHLTSEDVVTLRAFTARVIDDMR